MQEPQAPLLDVALDEGDRHFQDQVRLWLTTERALGGRTRPTLALMGLTAQEA